MCGIVGYVGRKDAESVLTVGLQKLEYRGYDSAGIALLVKNNIIVRKRAGKIHELINSLAESPLPKSTIGIAHTRWATHGGVCDTNAHPHLSQRGIFAVVHNGIIDNYSYLREMLRQQGYSFSSETDTEVIANLLEYNYLREGELIEALVKTVKQLEGSFALAILFRDDPDLIIGVRKDSPLVVGLGEEENILASDPVAILPHTKRVVYLDDGEIAFVRQNSVEFYDFQGKPIEKEAKILDYTEEDAEKGPYPHFMLKEIYEQPKVLSTNIERYVRSLKPVLLRDLNLRKLLLNKTRIIIEAAGTSYHAGLVGKYLLETYAEIPTEVEYSSEFSYRKLATDSRTLVVAISQSGETADTIDGLRYAKKHGLEVLAIVNRPESTIARESDYVIYTNAGIEVGVASTKAYVAQVQVLTLLALELAHVKGFLTEDELEGMMRHMEALPKKVERVLALDAHIGHIAERIYKTTNVMFLGRGINYPTALEGALKLKEVSYIHAIGYAAGEMKHGPLALVDNALPVVVINPRSSAYELTVSSTHEVVSRGGKVISVITEGDRRMAELSTHTIYVPEVPEFLTPIITIVPLQLLAYYAAVLRGVDPDKPRNLAKSVTVR
ncbi:MAG: glutamine--fructose-6-phosphate transaminase (isomerizing) [Thermotogae bacterium]|nr:glutamine--fructose-6-phosphate transaminase (isomerizing) [Thermotogota bacterium]